MTTPAQDSVPKKTVIEVQANLGESSPRLEDYLRSTTQELNALTEKACRGEALGQDSRDWMLAQVDFIVEVVGNETLELGDELRSEFLQLLLAIANLNEQVRQQNSLAL